MSSFFFPDYLSFVLLDKEVTASPPSLRQAKAWDFVLISHEVDTADAPAVFYPRLE